MNIPDKKSFTCGEVGRLMGVHRATVYRWVQSGLVVVYAHRPGQRCRIPRHEVVRLTSQGLAEQEEAKQ